MALILFLPLAGRDWLLHGERLLTQVGAKRSLSPYPKWCPRRKESVTALIWTKSNQVLQIQNQERGRHYSMNIPLAGGCVCGAIRYECSAEPIMMFKCHCRDCQRVTGGGFVAGLVVPASAFRLTKGRPRYHFTPSLAGGKHKRGFCADGGSRSPAENRMSGPPDSLESPPAVWTIRAGFARNWIFSFRTYSLFVVSCASFVASRTPRPPRFATSGLPSRQDNILQLSESECLQSLQDSAL